MMRTPSLPDFPWDSLTDAKKIAESHADGIINLSVGTPVDPVAPGIQLALAESGSAPGYPQTAGTAQLRDSISSALRRRYQMHVEAVLPVVGTKEAIAWLPTLLGAKFVVIPELAYPTYEVSARLAGANVLRADSLTQIGPARPDLLFINSPSNPTGKVLGIEHLRKVVGWAQSRGVIVASDECYLGLGWQSAGEDEPLSILDPRVCDGDTTNLIAIHSLSKTSNLASYRAGYLAGDPKIIDALLQARKHAGLMVPGPIQAAMVAALDDDAHELAQKQIYGERRAKLLGALSDAGFRIDNSEAGLYLWASRDEPCRDTVNWFAERGILVAPGDFYGPKGKNHVRISLTETDERIAAAVSRLCSDK
ncbi:succinyldiaminopimelate transaminase [Corynebacterium pseudodiphtheriticum]|uniref:succinyldiaminopimelate transaminase n=1 Tax=Corynebacterium pseudodiphtheriticum TaxID=37637 RepID=UPI0025401684|nr:succinyldiaminopimelate transaminase [Corynebacterium pseudodiphtheriticum]MDK4242692.1 succinyldiaminopimelate transaminase [Corynebacterium pseudodiphtheriticum]MDK4272764.1 succinyldiaminopimelate transaminase [Corynebacterium pseudodiphtheriticum]MDK4276850.1 succinyldiaminopimelate transaminase [Corynebacterium pseudodiphtheriticum]MDK4295694.1 succinyldiaminopimelate transaminase [Corynebacterium pseudodiphtheriticum]MDK8563324.1 succinyldiaminopimelate transaminase [Corynebacterium p